MLTMPADAGGRRSSTPWAKVQPLKVQPPADAKFLQSVVLNLPWAGGSELAVTAAVTVMVGRDDDGVWVVVMSEPGEQFLCMPPPLVLFKEVDGE